MASTVFVDNIPINWEFGILIKTSYQDRGENHREGDIIGHKMDFFYYLVLLKQKLE